MRRETPGRRLLLVQHGSESEIAVPAVAPGKELAVLGDCDGGAPSARRHRVVKPRVFCRGKAQTAQIFLRVGFGPS
jgi:hypothetical protein